MSLDIPRGKTAFSVSLRYLDGHPGVGWCRQPIVGKDNEVQIGVNHQRRSQIIVPMSDSRVYDTTFLSSPAFVQAMSEVMDQWIPPSRSYIRIRSQIPTAIEEWMGPAAFFCPCLQIMRDRIDTRSIDIPVVAPVETRIEQTAGKDQLPVAVHTIPVTVDGPPKPLDQAIHDSASMSAIVMPPPLAGVACANPCGSETPCRWPAACFR